MSEKRLTCDELAAALRVRPCTIRRWTWEAGIPYEPAGRLRFYDLEVVKSWLREKDLQRKATRREKGGTQHED